MGAARLGQAASDVVNVTVRRLLSCADAVTWPVWPVEHRVRIEAVKGNQSPVAVTGASPAVLSPRGVSGGRSIPTMDRRCTHRRRAVADLAAACETSPGCQ